MPALNYNSIDDVPDALKDMATPDEDGKVVIKVVAEEKLNEFRQRNIDLSQQIETLTPIMARVKNIAGDDLDAFENSFNEMKDIAKRVEDGELKTNDDIEKAVAARVENVKEGYEKNLKAERDGRVAAEKKSGDLQSQLDRSSISKEITGAILTPDSGVRPEALPDIMERAFRLFKWENGKPIPKNGESTIFGENGADPMTPTEWLSKLKDEAPHFFKGNGGGGGGGGGDNKGFGGLSKAEIAELTPQQKLELVNGA